MSSDAESLRRTPLHDLHVELGARMVPFAGYSMPVQYEGILAEHRWTRAHAGLFDVSHMGQAVLVGPDHEATVRALEALVPADILDLKPGQQRYTQLLGDDGGILDDLMVVRPAAPREDGTLLLVLNAATKEADYRHIASRVAAAVRLRVEDDLALLALQGPAAAAVLSRFAPEIATMPFMSAQRITLDAGEVHVSRSGYTGEDGFEISAPAEHVEAVAKLLLGAPEVKPIGLGARDSLRLEAGLPLYGHDIDSTTSPVEAGLAWSIQKRRRAEGGFPGDQRILRELADGPARKRVGIRPEGQAPAREGTEIQDPAGQPIGTVTSGGFGPSLGGPVAMGYVGAAHAAVGAPLRLAVRGRLLPALVTAMPFVPHRYHRSGRAPA